MSNHPPKFVTIVRRSPLLASFFLAAAAAGGVELRAGKLAVDVDPAFPRVIRYKSGQDLLDGQTAPVAIAHLNGQAATCRVSFRQVNAGTGDYQLTFPDAAVRFKPETRYRLTYQTMGDGHFIVESNGLTVANLKFTGDRSQVTGEFATTNDTESFLSLFKDGGDAMVIDDLAIDELGQAAADGQRPGG